MPLSVERIAELVAFAVHNELEPLIARVAALESRSLLVPRDGRDGIDGKDGKPGDKGERGDDGESITAEDVHPFIAAEVQKAVAEIPTPVNGKDGRDGSDGRDGASVTVDDVAPFVQAEVLKAIAGIDLDGMVQKSVAAIPVPKDGRDGIDGTSVDRAEVEDMVADWVTRTVAALPPPKDGESVDPAVVEAMVREHVTKAIAALPVPKDGRDGIDGQHGRSVTVEDVAPLIITEVQKAVSAIPPAKDGIGIVGTLIDRDGHLVLTLSDGSTKDVGVVVGRDVDMELVNRRLEDLVAAYPKPKDGIDGVGFDDLQPGYDDAGHLWLRFSRGEKSILIRVPGHVDRGVYKAGTAYLRGEGATWDGSYWIAQKDTSEKPGASKDWRLAVKRGTDGRTGPEGKAGPIGPRGEKGDRGPDRY